MGADTGRRERWRRYGDRQTASYDRQMAFPGRRLCGDSRAWACSQAAADTLEVALEVAIGTGLSLPHYPGGIHLTGIDLSPTILDRARARARQPGRAAGYLRARHHVVREILRQLACLLAWSPGCRVRFWSAVPASFPRWMPRGPRRVRVVRWPLWLAGRPAWGSPGWWANSPAGHAMRACGC